MNEDVKHTGGKPEWFRLNRFECHRAFLDYFRANQCREASTDDTFWAGAFWQRIIDDERARRAAFSKATGGGDETR
jgi:hypothetical protein